MFLLTDETVHKNYLSFLRDFLVLYMRLAFSFNEAVCKWHTRSEIFEINAIYSFFEPADLMRKYLSCSETGSEVGNARTIEGSGGLKLVVSVEKSDTFEESEDSGEEQFTNFDEQTVSTLGCSYVSYVVACF